MAVSFRVDHVEVASEPAPTHSLRDYLGDAMCTFGGDSERRVLAAHGAPALLNAVHHAFADAAATVESRWSLVLEGEPARARSLAGRERTTVLAMRFLLAALVLLSTACRGNAAVDDGGLDAAVPESDAEVDDAWAEDASVDHVCIPVLADAQVEDAASTDAWTRGDAWAPDTGDSCEGVPQGAYECSGFNGRECCGARWRYFYDGPCAPRRADSGTGTGPPACVSVPQSHGCPCSEEGAEACDWYHRIRCTCGTWREVHGIGCCGP